MHDLTSFRRHELADGLFVLTGTLPEALRLPRERFEEFWAMHPPRSPEVVLRGERMLAPRWHQAYGRDYEFAGAVSQALPVPPILQPMLEWTQQTVDARTNGILVNWYDAAFEHRIAQHRDSPIQRVPESPIVTISLGAERTFQSDRCGRRWDPETGEIIALKDLRKLKKRGHDPRKVLFVDDSPEKLQRSYGNLVAVRPFVGDPADDELLHLEHYLRELGHVENVRTIEKRGWRSRWPTGARPTAPPHPAPPAP